MKSHDKEVDLLPTQKVHDCFDFATFYDVTLDLDTVGMGGAAGLLLQNLSRSFASTREREGPAAPAKAVYAGSSAATVIVLSSAPRFFAS